MASDIIPLFTIKQLIKVSIVTQIENLVFDDTKRKNQYEAVRFAEKSLITKNGKAKLENSLEIGLLSEPKNKIK